MPDIKSKKPKNAVQYIVGAIVAFVVLVSWISMPLMDKSSWNTTAHEGNPFKSKTADLSSLLGDGEISSNFSPGEPLSGVLSDNPATSGEEVGSSLYRSGFSEALFGEDKVKKRGASAKRNIPSKGYSSASSPAPSPSEGKLAKVASIRASGSNSSTSGKYSKFFGGNAAEKPGFNPASVNASIGKAKKDSKMFASIGTAKKNSSEAANLKGKDEAGRSGASSAFTNVIKKNDSKGLSNLKRGAAQGGIAAGNVAGNLKKNAPNLSKKNVKLPSPIEDRWQNNDDKYKKLIFQLALATVITQAMGPSFGIAGRMMASQMVSSIGGAK